MPKKTVKDVSLASKRVLMRVDFNVPMDDAGAITDDKRIRAALPTIQYILDREAKLILMSHLGRPKGKVVESMRLKPVAERLAKLIGRQVIPLTDCVGDAVRQKTTSMKNGEIILLENLRFHKEETDNDEAFSRKLSELGDIYVNDAFGAAHRAHASTAGVARFLTPVAGFLLEREIKFIGDALLRPVKPFVAIFGGAKVSDKIDVIKNLESKIDVMLIGGGMAYTFLKSQGVKIGKSKLEDDKVQMAGDILESAKKNGVKVLLPEDHVIADSFSNDANRRLTETNTVDDGWMALDIGPKTINAFASEIALAGTIIWNGPLGVFEMANFSRGTEEVAKAVGASRAVSIIGGGDTAYAVAKFGLEGKMTHISTGGGASLEYMEGKILPGIAALHDKELEENPCENL